GVNCIDTPGININHAINVKNLGELLKDYSDKVGPTYTTLQLDCNTQNVAPKTDMATYNDGFAKGRRYYKHQLLLLPSMSSYS
ncbi:hypothetical protein pdam_00023958, partial [Pocillopora damicornis]